MAQREIRKVGCFQGMEIDHGPDREIAHRATAKPGRSGECLQDAGFQGLFDRCPGHSREGGGFPDCQIGCYRYNSSPFRNEYKARPYGLQVLHGSIIRVLGGNDTTSPQGDVFGKARPSNRLETRIRRDAWEIEFNRFRLGYMLQKTIPN